MACFTQINNTTGAAITVCGVTFNPSTPVATLSNNAIFSHAEFGRFLTYVAAGDLAGLDATAAAVSAEDTTIQSNTRRCALLNPDLCAQKIALAMAKGKLIRWDTGEEETPQTGVAYYSPDQTQVIGQTLKRQYYTGTFNTSSTGTLTLAATSPGVVCRSGMVVIMDTDASYHLPVVWDSDFIQAPRVLAGALEIARQAAGANSKTVSGWVDYY